MHGIPEAVMTSGSLCIPGRYDEMRTPSAVEQQWYALYVKSRQEFITHGGLLRKGIETYLPSIKRMQQWKDRKKCIEFPLFPGYLFVCVDPTPEEFFKVLRTRGAVKFVSLEKGSPTPVSPEEIDSLRMLIESGENFDIYPYLQEGMRVLVKRGPLKGAQGILEGKKDQYTFLVGVELLGRSIGVKICADDIESL
jgi:transcription termination/antitermination protein NusG